LADELQAHGRTLAFAANAGIFDPDFTPRGLHVEDGRESFALNLKDGDGNFYLKPNGVFLVDADGARIVDSTQYGGTTPSVRLATQSGPLLLANGLIHSRFTPGSPNRRLRSGVGVATPHRVCFIISRQPATFYELACAFHDRAGCRDALYLDGVISQFYLPGRAGKEGGGNFAGIWGAAVLHQDGMP
jgi:uncharacterized protein YigE (DUF2233 family)